MEGFKNVAGGLSGSGSNLVQTSVMKAGLTAESRSDTGYRYFGGHDPTYGAATRAVGGWAGTVKVPGHWIFPFSYLVRHSRVNASLSLHTTEAGGHHDWTT